MKITKATFRAFVNKNRDHLLIRVGSCFNGMIDGLEYNPDPGFSKAKPTERNLEHTLGVQGIWLVGCGRDYFKPFDAEVMTGFSVSNSCGSFEVAVWK